MFNNYIEHVNPEFRFANQVFNNMQLGPIGWKLRAHFSYPDGIDIYFEGLYRLRTRIREGLTEDLIKKKGECVFCWVLELIREEGRDNLTIDGGKFVKPVLVNHMDLAKTVIGAALPSVYVDGNIDTDSEWLLTDEEVEMIYDRIGPFRTIVNRKRKEDSDYAWIREGAGYLEEKVNIKKAISSTIMEE